MIYTGREADVWLHLDGGVLWITADYHLNMLATDNYLDTLDVSMQIFDKLKELGIERVYCTAASQSAFDFNERLGFTTANHVFNNKYEVMVKEL